MAAWYRSDQWRDALQTLGQWWEGVVEFVRSEDYDEPPARGVATATYALINYCDDLAPHIDPTPVWDLWLAIEKFQHKYHGMPPPHHRPLPSARELYILLDAAQLVVLRLQHAGITNKEPVREGEANRLLVDTLTPVQDAIFRVLTPEFQKAEDIADAANINVDEVRRQLPNLKRLGLADNKRGEGYRSV